MYIAEYQVGRAREAAVLSDQYEVIHHGSTAILLALRPWAKVALYVSREIIYPSWVRKARAHQVSVPRAP